MVAASAIAPLFPFSIPKRLSYPSRTISMRASTPRRNLSLSAQSNGPDGNGNGNGNGNGSNGELEERRSSPLVDLSRWRDLLSVDPENIVAVGLTGILTLASVQSLFQLLFISFAIILAAVKYSFIAALLLFILITLL